MTVRGVRPQLQPDTAGLWAAGRLGQRPRGAPEVVFAQVREDAEVEVTALAQRPTPEVAFCIGSGGCTALALLTGGPAAMYVVDINPAQIYLLELKQAAFVRLPYAAMIERMAADARPAYPRLRPLLSPEARGFWDERQHRLDRGLNQCGIIERKLTRAACLLLPLLLGRGRIEAMFQQTDLAAQRRFFEMSWDNWRWRSLFRWALSRPVLRLLYGRPFVDQIPPGFPELIKQQVDAAFVTFPIRENGSLWQTFLGRYPPGEKGFPIYLRPEHYGEIRAGLDRMGLAVGDAAVWLAGQPAGSIGFFALSNILELATPEYAAGLMAAVCRAAKPGALLCVRSIFPPGPDDLRRYGSRLMLDEALSAKLTRLDRSLFCKFIRVLRVNP